MKRQRKSPSFQLRKSIIFFSTGASVDFHCDLLIDATWPSRAGVSLSKDAAPALKKLGKFVGLAKDAKKMRAKDDDFEEEEEEEEEDHKDSGIKMFAKTQIFKLHGSLSKEERAGYIADFLKVSGGILLASDAASRGLDFPQIDWIIQYDPPQRRPLKPSCHLLALADLRVRESSTHTEGLKTLDFQDCYMFLRQAPVYRKRSNWDKIKANDTATSEKHYKQQKQSSHCLKRREDRGVFAPRGPHRTDWEVRQRAALSAALRAGLFGSSERPRFDGSQRDAFGGPE